MPLTLDPMGPQGRYHPQRRQVVNDIRGRLVADLGVVSSLFLHRSMIGLRAAGDPRPRSLPDMLADAGDRFAHGAVDGVSPDEFRNLVCRVSGMPISVVASATESVRDAARDACSTVSAARPVSAVEDWRDPSTVGGRAVWKRRGATLAVNASGNHPGVHSLWLEALALGYRVAVRPSNREPFTPHRLVAALWEAGFDGRDVILLPTDHALVEPFLASADLGVAFGGGDVVDRYRGDPRILTQGPGRAKVLLTGEVTEEDIDLVVDSVIGQAGMACVNATALFVEQDPHAVAERVAQRLRSVQALPPEDVRAVLPCAAEDRVRAVAAAVERAGRGTTAVLGAECVASPFGDGSAAMRPAVHVLDGHDDAVTGLEMPFPCLWVAPWAGGDVEALRDSLVVTVVTDDESLIGELVREPTIGNVYVGHVPTHWTTPGVPHDGFLAEFLMRTIGVAR